jgi:hypothetical protein
VSTTNHVNALSWVLILALQPKRTKTTSAETGTN